MERRKVLKGVLAVFGAGAIGASMLPGSAEAAAIDTLKPKSASPDQAEPDLQAEPADLAEPDAEGQYYFYRRRRARRFYYRPRRRVVYYRRPRRVYYYRPRRRYIRRVYW